MSEYEPLITNETWQEIHGVYRALKRMGCIEGNREPFFAVGQPGFKAQTSKKLSVVFCGIAAGNADGTSADYDAAVEAFDDEHFGLTPDGARPDWGLFWREIADVRLLLRKLLPDREFRAGWANILPINDNCGHTNAPWPELADKQKALTSRIWHDLMQFSGADVVVATFHQKWFDLAEHYGVSADGRPWVASFGGKIWQKMRTTSLPHVIWVNHVRGRTRKSEPKAEHIAAAIVQNLG